MSSSHAAAFNTDSSSPKVVRRVSVGQPNF